MRCTCKDILNNREEVNKMAKLESTEQIRGIYDNQKYDFDRYNFITCSPVATKEISVVVDFANDEISGDKIAYGSWFKIELIECIELLETLKPCDIKRDFKNILKRNKDFRKEVVQ